ncbi:unnamed protein product [Eruca vesicaria subsp. sativa]|uniref:Phosphatidylinositol-glycan biosynthesis class X protein n=1 Tax=Eruca vesicaria subsp. sativa TaxID=29727 RepID=A0ABC8KDB2_ERUVS|nr:unnamed protein product [Eruca vesicaria subsp. sativa]
MANNLSISDGILLQYLSAFRDVPVFGDTDLEQPSFRSNRYVVEIHVDISSGDAEISVKLPLHARYQPLGERVEFGEPYLFLCSRHVPNQGQDKEDVGFCPLPDLKPKPDPLSGKSLLESGVIQTAVLSAFSITVASVLSSKVEFCKKAKQS